MVGVNLKLHIWIKTTNTDNRWIFGLATNDLWSTYKQTYHKRKTTKIQTNHTAIELFTMDDGKFNVDSDFFCVIIHSMMLTV